MKQIYGDECLSRSRVHEWYSRFKDSREDVNDDQHVGQSKFVIIEDAIKTAWIRQRSAKVFIEINGNGL